VTVLIISGIRVFFHTTAQGVFRCQRCAADRHYRRRSGRRFVTLFYMRILPLAKVGEHVQCATCRTRYHPHVLTQPVVAGDAAAAAGHDGTVLPSDNLKSDAVRTAAP
jgi:hypothetical protein